MPHSLFDSAATPVAIDPSGALRPGTNYQQVLDGFKDARGASLAVIEKFAVDCERLLAAIEAKHIVDDQQASNEAAEINARAGKIAELLDEVSARTSRK